MLGEACSIDEQHCAADDKHGMRSRLRHCAESHREVVGTPYLDQRLRLNTEHSGRQFCFLRHGTVPALVAIRQERNSGHARQGLLKELETLRL